MFLEKLLWSGSSTTLSGSRLENILADFMASFSLEIAKLFIAARIASCTLVSIVAATLSNFTLYFVTNASPKCLYIHVRAISWGLVVCIIWKCIHSHYARSNFNMHVMIVPLIIKSASTSSNWLKSFLFCCFSLRVETIVKLTNEFNQTFKVYLPRIGEQY